MSSIPFSLRLLHYSTPPALVLSAVLVSSTSACVIRPSQRLRLGRGQRTLSKWIVLAITTSYLGEGLSYIFRACSHEYTAEQDAIFYVTVSVLVWSGFFLTLSDAVTVYWLPNLCSWVLATFLDIALCLENVKPSLREVYFSNIQLAIQLLRIFCLVGLCTIVSGPTTPKSPLDVERQPLLGSGDSTPVESVKYGSVSESDKMSNEESEDDNSQSKLRKEHRERIEDLGGWWGYLQQFRVFLPHLIPIKSSKLQGYAVCVALLIISDRVSNLLGPHLIGNIVNRIAETKEEGDIPWRQVLFFIFVIKIPHDHILVPLRSCISTRLSYWSYRSLLMSSFAHIIGLSLDFHENKSTGEVEMALRQGDSLSRTFDDLMNKAVPLLLDIIVAFVYLSWLFSVTLGLVIAVVYFAYVIITYRCTVRSASSRRKYLDTGFEEQQLINESLANWQTAVYFNRQDYLQHRMADVTQRYITKMAQYNDISHVTYIGQGLVMSLGYCAVLLLAAHQVKSADQPVGNVVTLLLYWTIITQPLFQLAHYYKSLIEDLVESERILQIRNKKSTVTDVEGARDLNFKGGKIEYRNVHFSYERNSPLIRDLNFTVEPGSTIAFVGATGSGKTTTCDKLLFRMYDVTKGSILIDDQDIRDVTQFSLRETMGLVRQDQSFYNDTILETVRFARLNATDEEVFESCRNAVIHDKILTFPNGYHSKIGERGVKLSGGEKQRLFIAQLFLRDPKIVVLDEATSTVDNITEAEIQESFARICKGRTTVIIAHRLSTVKDADQIFVLDQGQIVERGSHDELLRMGGKYYELWATKKTAQKIQKLQKALTRGTSASTSGNTSTSDLIDLSDDSDGFSSSSSTAPILQVDGGAESKQMKGSNPARSGLRKQIQDVKSHFVTRKPDEEEAPEGEYDAEAEAEEGDDRPIKTISPKPTITSIGEPKARRSISMRRRSKGSGRPGAMSAKKTVPLEPNERDTTAVTSSSPKPSPPLREERQSTPQLPIDAQQPPQPLTEAALSSLPDTTSTWYIGRKASIGSAYGSA